MSQPDRRCIGCGKSCPRMAVQKGWTITRMSSRGLTMRTYRHCGCLTVREYCALSADLFEAGLDYPVVLPRAAAGDEENDHES